jgi:hypothetical protein
MTLLMKLIKNITLHLNYFFSSFRSLFFIIETYITSIHMPTQ